MNLRDLMTRLDTIAEADVAGADPQRAAYDKFKADDAKTAAIATVKKYASIPLNQIPRLANAIDPKTGIIYYGDPTGESGEPQPKKMPFQFMAQADQKSMMDALTLAGLKVTKTAPGKGMFGEPGGYAMVDPRALADIDKPRPGPTPGPTPGPSPVRNTGDNGDGDAAKLDALVAQLEATLGGDIAPMPSPPTPTPTPTPKTPEKTLGQKAGVGAGIAAGGLAGAALGKKYGGAKGAVLGGLTGGALGGMGVNAFQENFEFNSSIAQTLTESFGYDFEDEQLDEYSMDQFGKDAGDFGRGAWNGATLGAGDNIYAGVKSAFGSGTYKDELAKQTAASKEAEARSPALYTAGNIAGSLAAPIPGGAIAGGVMRGAKALGAGAKLATGVGMAGSLGANMLAQQGVDKLKSASDTKTLGYDPSKYPTTPQEIKAFQSANGLTPDGIAGPKTQAVLAKMGLTPPKPATVAEDIKSLQEKLAMIENGQWQLEEDADYRVWLTEDNTVIDDNGNQIVDESVLDAIEWDQARLDELSLGGLGKSLGRGYDAVANVGRNFAGGLAGKDATGNLIKDTEKNFASRMSAPKANGKVRSAAEIARDSTNARGTANMANKAANYVGKNPGKVALGAAALGAGGIAAANALGGDGETGTNTGDGTGGIGGSETGTTTAPAPSPSTPNDSGKLTPEQQELVKQIHALMMSHGDDPNPTPVWMKSAEHAQAVLDKAEHASTAQTDQDKKAAAEAAATAVAGEKKAADTGGSAASPTGTTNPLPKVPAGTDISKSGTTMPDPTLKVYKEDDELARWLKIARG